MNIYHIYITRVTQVGLNLPDHFCLRILAKTKQMFVRI